MIAVVVSRVAAI